MLYYIENIILTPKCLVFFCFYFSFKKCLLPLCIYCIIFDCKAKTCKVLVFYPPIFGGLNGKRLKAVEDIENPISDVSIREQSGNLPGILHKLNGEPKKKLK